MMFAVTQLLTFGPLQVSCGWKHNAAVGRRGQLLTWGWGGSQGSQSFYDSRCSVRSFGQKPSPTSFGGYQLVEALVSHDVNAHALALY